ncbi:MAG: galactose ABC transporter substrate-binding protein [Eubacteriales bacterium]|nr:galactose ABC transporter substrate-binding protein [Eubacteriales bacterium]
MKRLCILLALLLALAPAALADELGVCLYNQSDTFISSVSLQIQKEAGDGPAPIVMDAQNDQNTQNDQVDELLAQGVDALILNPVDRTAAVYLVRKAAERNVPVIFINREPLPEDLALYDGAYYVGTDPKETGRLCGQLVADYFTAHPEADRNGDGVIQYVLFKGETGHQDAEYRTQYSIRAITDAGFQVERLGEESASWERSLGQEKMALFLSLYDTRIECVISNNDDMALGAIDALKAAGWFTPGGPYMPVVGVDATAPALEALRQGTLLGTVLNDATNLGRAAWELASLLARGEPVTADNFSYPLDEHRRVYIPSQRISQVNCGR